MITVPCLSIPNLTEWYPQVLHLHLLARRSRTTAVVLLIQVALSPRASKTESHKDRDSIVVRADRIRF